MRQIIRLPANITLAEAKRRLIDIALFRNKGDKEEAARQLGVSLKTLYNHLNRSPYRRRNEAEKAGTE